MILKALQGERRRESNDQIAAFWTINLSLARLLNFNRYSETGIREENPFLEALKADSYP